MRMRELSEATGVPVPTVKYYLREGLISPGERTGPNQARYNADHLRQIRQVRALAELGGLSVAQIRAVLAGQPVPRRPAAAVPHADRGWALTTIENLARVRAWPATADPALLAEILCAIRDLCPDALDNLDKYADVVDAVARIDLDPAGSVLTDALLLALRRFAREPGQAARAA